MGSIFVNVGIHWLNESNFWEVNNGIFINFVSFINTIEKLIYFITLIRKHFI